MNTVLRFGFWLGLGLRFGLCGCKAVKEFLTETFPVRLLCKLLILCGKLAFLVDSEDKVAACFLAVYSLRLLNVLRNRDVHILYCLCDITCLDNAARLVGVGLVALIHNGCAESFAALCISALKHIYSNAVSINKKCTAVLVFLIKFMASRYISVVFGRKCACFACCVGCVMMSLYLSAFVIVHSCNRSYDNGDSTNFKCCLDVFLHKALVCSAAVPCVVCIAVS